MTTTGYYWSASWVSANEEGMPPGAVHSWNASPFEYSDVVSLTAHAVVGNPTRGGPGRLTVEQIETSAYPGGQRGVLWRVRNSGTVGIIGYSVRSSVVSA